MHLPPDSAGVIYDTASISTMHALAAARELSIEGVRSSGLSGRTDVRGVRVYCSEQAHSSIDKSAIVLGLGRDAVVRIRTDAEFRMDPQALGAAIRADRASGLVPIAVIATCGTTSTTSVDPVAAVADVCAEHRLWLHVDAAYAGVAAMVPGFDLSVLFTRRMDVLRQAFALSPDYLQTTATESALNLMDTGIQLGRRFRALKLWAILRYFGAEGIRSRLREHVRIAQLFGQLVDADSDFERVAPTPFSVVCFRARGSDELNERLLARVNQSGHVFLSHTRLNGRFVLRLAVGNLRTEERHVRMAWDIVTTELRAANIEVRA
jgi:aromatic-L-amino-acid decarboxylase